jgi:hypothetical protein
MNEQSTISENSCLQLTFEGFPTDLYEKPYSPVNRGLLDTCSEFIFLHSGIDRLDFETRNSCPDFFGKAITTMHNRLYAQTNLNLMLMHDVCLNILTPNDSNSGDSNG